MVAEKRSVVVWGPGKRIHPGFETQGKNYQKSKLGVPLALQKVLIFFR